MLTIIRVQTTVKTVKLALSFFLMILTNAQLHSMKVGTFVTMDVMLTFLKASITS